MASTSVSAPRSREPGTRRTGAIAPVEVSLCGQACTSTSSAGSGSATVPAGAEITWDGSRNGAAVVAAANFAPNSPNAACCAFERTRHAVATSQNVVEPPLPSTTS